MELAHSAKCGVGTQSYYDHVQHVEQLAIEYANNFTKYAAKDVSSFIPVLTCAALLHDLGKLDKDNQKALLEGNCRTLPIHHQDAGAAYYLDSRHRSFYSACLIRSHHVGLPDIQSELNRGEYIFRDEYVYEKVNNSLSSLLSLHRQNGLAIPEECTRPYNGNRAVYMRLLLSCLADADHSDTAAHYGHQPLILILL